MILYPRIHHVNLHPLAFAAFIQILSLGLVFDQREQGRAGASEVDIFSPILIR